MKCEIYLVPFAISTRARLAEADVIRLASREIIIHNVIEDACIRTWRKVSIDPYFQNVTARPDLRVVFVFGEDTLAFDGSGARGTVNGKPAAFTPAVTKWFLRYISTLQGT